MPVLNVERAWAEILPGLLLELESEVILISQILGWNIYAAKDLNGSDSPGSQCLGIVIGVFALSSSEQ